MAEVQLGLALFLLLNMAVGLTRVWAGPTTADRMLAAQLFGTTGTGALLLLFAALSRPALLDVALTLALLAVVATVVFVRRVWGTVPAREKERHEP
jgi:multicomponent Na+:H+ antiporter subunit F